MNYISTSFIFFALIVFSSTSFTQLEWIKDPNNPVMSGGASGTWYRHVWCPKVLYNADSARYEMWFSAAVDPVNWNTYRIGFATSINGITWIKHDMPVLSPDPGTWDGGGVGGHSVIRESGGEYKMWYTGLNESLDTFRIGYAASDNGISWTKDPMPVMNPGEQEWESTGPFTCIVMPVSGEYKMWYGGVNTDPTFICNIGYATSLDGKTWDRDTLNNPVLRIGEPGAWDDNFVGKPYVLQIGARYYMWYSGEQNASIARQIGLAYSSNGIDWMKYDDSTTTSVAYANSDPVLKPSFGQWDADYVQYPSILLIGDTLHMWYDGSRSPATTYLWRIGHATLHIDSLLIIPTDIRNIESTQSLNKFVLHPNYPNPFNPTTTIEFDLPNTSEVTLKVYNILGEEVAKLVSDRLSAGSYSYEWDASNLASGVYLYRLETEGLVKTRKLILMK